MLNGIPKSISPELLKVLCEMGHSDVICIGDGNFPADRFAREGNCKIVRADGIGCCELLESILKLMPADSYVDCPITLMKKAPIDKDLDISIWDEFETIISKYDSRHEKAIRFCDRFEFYEQAKKCYCIVQSGEEQIYANVMIQKGVIK